MTNEVHLETEENGRLGDERLCPLSSATTSNSGDQ